MSNEKFDLENKVCVFKFYIGCFISLEAWQKLVYVCKQKRISNRMYLHEV